MFYKPFLLCAVLATLHSIVLASPTLSRGNYARNGDTRSLADAAKEYPQLLPLEQGNEKFRQSIANSDQPNLLQNLTVNGQHPDFVFIGCADSRASEGTVFATPPGTLFTERNIANQYAGGDTNAVATLAYGVSELNAGHIIVMGHYGCGGVQAAILDKPANLDRSGEVVQAWVDPIRTLYHSSTRDEIVKLRESRAANSSAGPPAFSDPGYRALVEENVKNSVSHITQEPIVTDHWKAFLAAQKSTTLKPLYVHGFVYDISTGEIYDLNVSQGPPGYNGGGKKRSFLNAIRRALSR